MHWIYSRFVASYKAIEAFAYYICNYSVSNMYPRSKTKCTLIGLKMNIAKFFDKKFYIV